MYSKILVALDGSELAERVLPLASDTARRFNAGLILLTVLSDPSSAHPGPVRRLIAAAPRRRGRGEQRHEDSRRSQAQRYVEDVATKATNRVRPVSTTVASGDPAEKIVQVAHEQKADLIVLAARGQSGLARGLLGSVTDRVLQILRVPVLIIDPEKAPPMGAPSPPIQQVILPVDGSEIAEGAIPHAADVASAFGAEVVLVRVVTGNLATVSDAFWGQSGDNLLTSEELEAEAKAYLGGIANRLERAGISSTQRVLRGRARAQIVALAQEMPSSMIVLTTRGATGIARWLMGSVANGLIRTAPVPILVVPPPGGRSGGGGHPVPAMDMVSRRESAPGPGSSAS